MKRFVGGEAFENTQLYLLMVLDAHADGVDQDGYHDASVEVFALYDAPQLNPDLTPNVFACFLWITAYTALFTVVILLAFFFTP